MLQFLLTVPSLVLYGCGVLIAVSLGAAAHLEWQVRRIGKRLDLFGSTFPIKSSHDAASDRDGLPLVVIEELRNKCGKIEAACAAWWRTLDTSIELYTSPEEREGWFLTEKPRDVLPYEAAVGRHFDSQLFGTFPGLLTGAGLTLTFVAILWALKDVKYDPGNAVEPIKGIDTLINGLSGKFLSSIVALLLSIAFTLFEKRAVRRLRALYDRMIARVSEFVPYLSESRVLLDIQRFAAKQTVSVSHISAEVVDRLVGAFNTSVVPALADGMSSGVAEKMQNEFRPMMRQMNDTLDGLKSAIVGLESKKQESVTGEITRLLESLERSLVGALSKMGSDFHDALAGAASREFGNVQGTLEATRQMLSEMNAQFGAMQAAFSTIIEKAEQATSDQLKTGREQTEALTALMNGLMVKMQESADQNLGSIRTQLTMVVGDLAEKVGSLSQEMMMAAEKTAKQAQNSASEVLDKAGEWSDATAKRLEKLVDAIQNRSIEFKSAGESLLRARDLLIDVIGQNSHALDRMADASRQVQAYTTGLAGQSDALKAVSQMQGQVTAQLREAAVSLRASSEQNESALAEHRRTFDGYKKVVDDLDQNLGRILGAIQAGLRDYNQSIENNFKEIVKISNPMISEAASFLQTQIDELSEQLEELGSVIATSLERVNGKPKQR